MSRLGPAFRYLIVLMVLHFCVANARAQQEEVSALVGSGFLGIIGTSGPDVITITSDDTGNVLVHSTVGGEPILVLSIPSTSLSAIDVAARGGDDLIDVSGLSVGSRGPSIILQGDLGDDEIVGSGYDDEIIAGPGNDTIVAGDGNDDINTGEGNNTVFGDSGDDTIVIGPGDNTISGGDGVDWFNLAGGVGRNTISGDEGRNRLNLGPSILDGPVNVSIDRGVHLIPDFFDTGKGGPGGTFDLVFFAPTCCSGSTLSDIHSLRIDLGDGANEFFLDDLRGTGLEEITVLGGGGEDVLTVRGTTGDDTLTVRPGRAISYGDVTLNFFDFEALSVDAFPSFFGGADDGDDVIRTVAFSNIEQTISGGGGMNTLIVDRQGQSASDTGASVEVGDAQAVNYSGVETVTVESVQETNHPPLPAPDTLQVREDDSGIVRLLDNDIDPDGDALSVVSAAQPALGDVEILTFGDLSFTPRENVNGIEDLTYTVSDGRGGTGEATVRVEILPVNDAPGQAVVISPADGSSVELTGDPETPIVVSWEAAADVDGDSISYTWELAATPEFLDLVLSAEAGAETSVTMTTGEIAERLTARGLQLHEAETLVHRVRATDGVLTTIGPTALITFTRGTITGTDRGGEQPSRYALHQNYPNPFNPVTTIVYELPEPARVELVIFDAIGRAVRTLVAREQVSGRYSVQWDGKDDAGAALPSGIYLYRIKSRNFRRAHAMILVK